MNDPKHTTIWKIVFTANMNQSPSFMRTLWTTLEGAENEVASWLSGQSKHMPWKDKDFTILHRDLYGKV